MPRNERTEEIDAGEGVRTGPFMAIYAIGILLRFLLLYPVNAGDSALLASSLSIKRLSKTMFSLAFISNQNFSLAFYCNEASTPQAPTPTHEKHVYVFWYWQGGCLYDKRDELSPSSKKKEFQTSRTCNATRQHQKIYRRATSSLKEASAWTYEDGAWKLAVVIADALFKFAELKALFEGEIERNF